MPKKKKSPFRNYTVEEVMASEAVTFIIQVGSDIYRTNNDCFFNKKSAIRHYNKILRVLLEQIHTGTKKERKNAKRVVENLKILPLRLH